jgi:hypothetical protein
MPDKDGHVTVAELRQCRDRLDRLIEDARRVRAEVEENLRSSRRGTQNVRRGQPYSGLERRSATRKFI